MFAVRFKLKIMDMANLFNVLVADFLGNFPELSGKELERRNLNITRIVNMSDFLKLINFSRFELIVCFDSRDYSDRDVVADVRASDKNSNTQIVYVFTEIPNNLLINNLYKAGVSDLVFNISDIDFLQKKIYAIQESNLLRIENNNLKQKLKAKEKKIQKVYKELAASIAESVSSMMELNKQSQLLEDRIEEQNCLIAINNLADDEKLPFDLLLGKIADIIASAFRNTTKSNVEIKYKNQIYQSEGFLKTNLVFRKEILYQKESTGTVLIYCSEQDAKSDNCIYLDEKKQLLSIILNSLGRIIHRKEVENRLKIFQRAVIQSPLMISVANVKTRKIEFINPKFSETYGLTNDDLEKVNSFILNSKIGESLQRKETRLEILKGKQWDGEIQGEKENGELFWQKLSLFPLVENGEVTHALGISEDITDEKRIIEELKSNKENYKHITENVSSGIAVINKEGKVLYVNKKVSEITGYSVSELSGFTLKDILHPDLYEDIKGRVLSRLDGSNKEKYYSTKLVAKNGEIITVETSGTKTKWKGELVDLVVFNDVTRKNRLSDLLNVQCNISNLSTIPKSLDEYFQRLFENLFRHEWIDGGGIYLMNEKQDKLNLVFNNGLSNRFIREVQTVPSDSGRFKMVMQKVPHCVSVIEAMPFPQNLIKEGVKSICILPLVYSDKVLGVLNIFTKSDTELSEDEKKVFKIISSRVAQMILLINSQDELKVKNQELEQMLKEVREKQQLLIQKSKLESIGEMAAGVAHEINQPLGVIFLSLENILFKLGKKSVSRDYLDKKLSSISENINKIKEIIDHVRTFSRDQKSIVIERVDVNDVINKACSMIDEQYKYHQINITLNLEKNVGYVLGNTHKLEQVMYNLLSNAKYAVEERDSLLSGKIFNKKIFIKTYINGDRVFIEVKDNGEGIETDSIDNVFNPFFTTKPEGKGTGLGLSIVYGIITEMNGSISIKSKRNEYTLVAIEFPHIYKKPETK